MLFRDLIFKFGPPGQYSGKNGLLPDRPNFGLNIKFDQISHSNYILYPRFLDMQMSFLAAIFTLRLPYIIRHADVISRSYFHFWASNHNYIKHVIGFMLLRTKSGLSGSRHFWPELRMEPKCKNNICLK